VGSSVAAGAAVALTVYGLRRAFRRRPEVDEQALLMRGYLDEIVDDAAYRVATGEDTDDAISDAFASRPPLIVMDSHSREARPGVMTELFSSVLTTALGFGIKIGMDMLAQRLTGEPEVIQAVQSARDDERQRALTPVPPPAVPPPVTHDGMPVVSAPPPRV
jgi:hypothetical protein